jgi:glycosyltransferase involved in cell wall biosynthesis
MQVSVIVPAFNEAGRIGAVLEVIHQARGLSEIIIVDDGSTDGTLEAIPSGNGFSTLRLEPNRGKGAALLAGAQRSRGEILLFLDADLVGLHPAQIEALVAPVVRQEAEMSIAVFKGGRWRTDWAQKLVPGISGQRAMKREFFLSISGLEKSRYGVETALGRAAARRRLRVSRVPWQGVTHVMKEEKLGWSKGMWERIKMYEEIGSCLLRGLFGNGHGHSLPRVNPSASDTGKAGKPTGARQDSS